LDHKFRKNFFLNYVLNGQHANDDGLRLLRLRLTRLRVSKKPLAQFFAGRRVTAEASGFCVSFLA
jgi:hypothetical protein